MTTTQLPSHYQANPSTGIWQRPGYAGIPYSDGKQTEAALLATLQQVQDVSSLSAELAGLCSDWVSYYHLSGVRANVVRPFANKLQGQVLEIGAGCGAITRYLGESGAQVLALEGSLQRARIARERTRDLPNVTLLAENFEHFQTDQRFDVITLIGVLEYSAVFISGDNAAQRMLEKVKGLLKPGGQLIVAIENQLGLKYFAGAPEDHLGQTAVGLENRYTAQGVRTYGQRALQQLLQSSGLAHTQFFGAFPDYKLPCTLVSEQGMEHPVFDAGALISQSTKRDLQLPVHLHFSPDLVWPGLVRNGLGMHLANSFVVVASAQALTPNTTLAWHMSAQRRPEFCKQTVFTQGEGAHGVRVQVQRLIPNAPTLVQDGTLINRLEAEPTYHPGETGAQGLLALLLTPQWRRADLQQQLNAYLGLLAQQAGLSVPLAQDTPLSGHCFDALPQNFIRTPQGEVLPIDTEWQLDQSLSTGFVLFRALSVTLSALHRIAPCADATFTSPQDWLQLAFASVGFELSAERLQAYVAQEAAIQSTVTGVTQDPQITLKFLANFVLPQTDLTTLFHQQVPMFERQVAVERENIKREFENSTSWRLSAPVRWFKRLTPR